MSTKNATKTASKKSEAKAKGATEKARKAAIATIGKRLGDDGAATAAKPTKATKTPKKPKGAPKANPAAKGGKVSALDAAATVLAASKEPMRTKDIVEQMAAKKLWSSANGKTPEATLHAALMREISVKKSASRFSKAGRGLFASSGKAA